MQYREFRPERSLRPFVRLLWSLKTDAAPSGVERIVPDGCPEIVVNRADRFRRLRDGSFVLQAPVLLVGPLQRAITIAPSGAVDLVGIRFEPAGLHALLGAPMRELVDEDRSLAQVQRRLRDELVDALGCAPLAQGRAAVERVLAAWLERRGRLARGHGLAGAALRLVESGLPTIEHVASSLGIQRRALERLFRAEVGLSPKLYRRIYRLQSVLQDLDGGSPARGWAHLALEHGYADQPHLIRDYRLLAGTTPQRHLAQRTALATFLESRELSHSSNRQVTERPTLDPSTHHPEEP